MKNKSRFLAMALAGAMLLAMTGCGEKAASELENMLSMGLDPRLFGTWESTALSGETMELKFNNNGTATCYVIGGENPEGKDLGNLKWNAIDTSSMPSFMPEGLPDGMTEEEYQEQLKEMAGKWQLNIMDAASYDAMPQNPYEQGP